MDLSAGGSSAEQTTARVHDALERFLASRRELVHWVDPRVDELAGLLADFVVQGGKRMRPRFALAGWACVRGAVATPDEVVVACAALELIQACALVHDDIVDASDTRRGRPTVHREAEALHRGYGWGGDAARYGVSQAILLGDLALSWADEMFATSGADPAALGRALEPWSAMKTEVLSGQMLDVLAEASGATDELTPRQVNRFKTAAYTVERPLHVGAALAGASDEVVGALRRFGVAVGSAFQLRDDLLGVFGDPEVTGKPSGDDLREGKRTLLVARGMRLGSAADSERISQLLGTDASEAEVDEVRRLLEASGAVDSLESEISALTETAVEALGVVDLDADGRARLEALAGAATRRSS